MREEVVDTGRLRLAVRDHPGGEPTLVCLHGLASNARWWDLVAARLAPAHRVLAVDQRGHGGSDRPDDGYGFDDVVADLEALLATLRIERPVLVGHSWGASVALVMAAERPDAVRGVVCVDGGIMDLRAHFGDTWERAEVAMAPPDLDGVADTAVRAWVESGPLREGSDVDTALRILLGNFEEVAPGRLRPRLTRTRHLAIARALYHLDTPAVLARLRVPVVFVLARQDGDPRGETRRQAAERAVALAGGPAGLVWVDGMHDLPVQRPTEVAAAVEGFLAGLPDR